eukprot:GHVO01044211.1.p1 GENE.GHVO01044211.1~~GHVO01044211.1.p1  ORF type:complete len:298 (+),score=59.68 GHVO01044211.1:89-895(+)
MDIASVYDTIFNDAAYNAQLPPIPQDDTQEQQSIQPVSAAPVSVQQLLEAARAKEASRVPSAHEDQPMRDVLCSHPSRPPQGMAYTMFNLTLLLDLQILLMKRFYATFLSTRGYPQISCQISNFFYECRSLQQDAATAVTKYQCTCQSVLRVLPDLSLAVTENAPDLALQLFQDIRSWVVKMKDDAISMHGRYKDFDTNLHRMIDVVREFKRLLDANIAFSSLTSAPQLASAPTNTEDAEKRTIGETETPPPTQLAQQLHSGHICSIV